MFLSLFVTRIDPAPCVSLVCTSESEEWKWKETAGTWGWAHGGRGCIGVRARQKKRRGMACIERAKERTRGGLCDDIIPHLHKSQSESWLVTGGRNRSRLRFSSFSMLSLFRPQSVCACVRWSPSAVSFSAARRRASLLSPVDSQSAPNSLSQSFSLLAFISTFVAGFCRFTALTIGCLRSAWKNGRRREYRLGVAGGKAL